MVNLKGSRAQGFSLIELMLVVVILSVLLGIAVPAYSGYVEKARRSDARNALMAAAAAQERWFFINNSYTSDENNIGGNLSPDEHYDIEITVATGNTFTVTATAVSGGKQTSDFVCAKFEVDETGDRLGFNGDDDAVDSCW
ncbi:MAG: type IV pilin protein [Pseudomonadales bacterium]